MNVGLAPLAWQWLPASQAPKSSHFPSLARSLARPPPLPHFPPYPMSPFLSLYQNALARSAVAPDQARYDRIWRLGG